MPALSHLYSRLETTAAADTRIVNSRQLGELARRAAHSISAQTGRILDSAPRLVKRASCGFYIQTCYQGLNAGPAPGAVVGIVLGSIAGFLLILWLLWVLSNGTSFIRTTDEEVITTSRRRSGGSRRSHRSTYNAEVRQSSPRRERVIRQERIVRNVPREREQSRARETVIVEETRSERRVDGDDVVEVIEEHSSLGGGAPPPRRKSGRKSSGYR